MVPTAVVTASDAQTPAESNVESVTAEVADMKVSEPAAAASKPAPDVSTSMATKHEEEYPHEEETAEERAKREAELQKIYADLAKEDDRYLPMHVSSGHFRQTLVRMVLHILTAPHVFVR